MVIRQDGSNEFPVACPMSVYPEYRSSRPLWRDDFGELIVRIETDVGVEGIGYTSMGSLVSATTIRFHLARLLIGKDPTRVERLHDIMLRSTMHQGRDGFLMHAISALDLALWDIRAKLAGVSVCTLLGGPILESLPCYMTGYDDEKARASKFFGIKIPLKYGPASGREGLKANVADVAALRERGGEDFDIMLDCWMGLDVAYTLELAKQMEPLRVRWIEEPLQAGDVDGYRQLRRSWNSSILIATGEHEALARQASPFLKERLADVWQADVTWAGGITAMSRIAALCLDSDIKLIPHYGYLPWSAQFNLATPACPAIEWYALTQALGEEPIFSGDMPVKDGRLFPGTQPGFGITVNWEAVEAYRDRRIAL
jgi:L-rhamnonate dehydratase